MKVRWILVWLALLAPPAWSGAPLVIVMSWDGMRYDYPDRAVFPGLTRMQQEGVRAERLVAGWPSSTFPGHTTLATGAWAATHGIVDNEFLDRVRGRYAYSSDASWLNAEPLWITAERQGVHAATYFWVGSETDWHDQHQQYRIAPFNGETPESVKVDQIFEQDAQLVRLLDGIDVRHLWDDTTVILVSDHGMTALHGFFDLAGYLDENGYPARVFGGPGVTHVFLNDASQLAGAFALLSARKPLDVYRGAELPERFHLNAKDRVGDLVVVSDPSLPLAYPALWVRTLYAVLGPVAGVYPGSHGFDPNLPEMGALMMAMGRGVPKGARIGAIPMIDIAPTVAKLLSIEPPLQSEGKSISEIGN